MTHREFYTTAINLFEGSQQVWTPIELAEKLDCTTQRATAILRKAELDGCLKSFTIDNRRQWIGSDDFIPITIEWITESEYYNQLSIKKKFLWIMLDFLEEWWYN
jgi:hypothetical protein